METGQNNIENHELRVRSLDGFEILWNGRSLFEEYLSKDTQFTRLMGLLLHRSQNGVDREMLKRVLLADSKTDDSAHMLRSVIYNTKRKLKQAMGDSVEYIVFRKGKYYWTESIPVVEDALQFEGLCNAAFTEEDPEHKLQKLLRTCNAYSGEFMPIQGHLNWANEERTRYAELYREALEEAAAILVQREDFQMLEEIGKHAVYAQPFSNWEGLVIGAMLGQGNYSRAQDYYDKVLVRYVSNLGVNPTEDMLALTEKIGLRSKNRFAELDEIERNMKTISLQGAGNGREGGIACIFPVMCGIYHILERFSEKGCCLMLCNFRYEEGMQEDIDTMNADYTSVLQRAVRRIDVVCRFGKGQYLILFPGDIAEAKCVEVQKTITREVCKGQKGLRIEYELKELNNAG